MRINVDSRYNAKPDFLMVGYMGETNARTITFEGLEVDGADLYKMQIKYADGNIYELDITDGSVTLGASVYRQAGYVTCQILACKSVGDTYTLVKKSNLFRLKIGASNEQGGIPTYEQSIEALDKVLAYESQSKEYAERAEQAASRAEDAQADISVKAQTVADNADKAARSADTAVQSANKAEQMSASAEQSAASASKSADTAGIAADNADTSAQTASTAAEQAKSSADTAAGYSTTAGGYARTASESADNAANSAAGAANAAYNASKSATAAKAAQTAAEGARDTAVQAQADVTAKSQQVTDNAAQVAEDRQAVAQDKTAAETAATSAEQSKAAVIAAAESIPADYAELSNNVSQLKEDLQNYLKVKETVLETDNLLDINDLTVGYVDLNGNISSNNGFKYTRFEPVKPNTTYTVWRMIWSNNFNHRFVTFYDKEKNVISNAGCEMTKSFTTTNNTYYVIMSFDNTENITLDRKPMVTEGTELPSEYKPYRNEFVDYVTEYVKKADFDTAVEELEEKIKNKTVTPLINEADVQTADTIQSGGNISIEASNSKQNNTIGFFCNIGSDFGSVRVSHGLVSTHGRSASIIVDSTNVYLYSDVNTLVGTYPHSLTISDFLQISIVVWNNYKCEVMVSSKGGYFIKNDLDWNGCTESVKAESISGTLTNAKLTWHVSDYNHKTWCFGDSYFDYWIPKMKSQLGIYNYMVDSYSGRASQKALASFKLAIKKATPQNVLWCMGMNDPDTDTAISTTWKTSYDELAQICDEKGIDLILVTIPNTPDRNHTFKNDFIKSSGKRYVDIARTLGAETYPSGWYDGLIGLDNVHPSDMGTRVITNAMVIGCPELTSQNK